MGGGPVITQLRPGVAFTPEAAASFLRAEAEWGQPIDANSTYRDWDVQMSMHLAWEAWVAGRGPKPWHSRAIHPRLSVHCQARALDSDDWTRPGFIALMSRHGWIRTAAGDPTEQHHFEYQVDKDQHRNEPAPAGVAANPIGDEDEMIFYNFQGHLFAIAPGHVKHFTDKGAADYAMKVGRTGDDWQGSQDRWKFDAVLDAWGIPRDVVQFTTVKGKTSAKVFNPENRKYELGGLWRWDRTSAPRPTR